MKSAIKRAGFRASIWFQMPLTISAGERCGCQGSVHGVANVVGWCLLAMVFLLQVSQAAEIGSQRVPRKSAVSPLGDSVSRIPESLLVQPGDLPAGLSGGQVRETAPAMFKSLPIAQTTIYQQLARHGSAIGGVAVFVYNSGPKLDIAYAEIVRGMDSNPAPGIGERAQIATTQIGEPSFDLVSARCGYVFHIRISGAGVEDNITSYAKRLDKRLASALCP